MSTPGRGRGRGAKPIAAPRGRGRRTDADRARLLQEESERTKARETEYAAEVAAQAREDARRKAEVERRAGRGSRGGRGGFMGDHGRHLGPTRVGGISSFAPSKTQFKGRPVQGGRAAETSRPRKSAPARIKSEPSTEVDTPFTTTDPSVIPFDSNDGYVSSDQEDSGDGPRQDIDTIDLAEADDDVEYLGTSLKKTLRARPMRLVHRPHQDRAIQIDTEAGGAAIAKNAANAVADNYIGYQSSAAPKGTRPVWRGAWADSDDDDEDGIVPGGFVDRESEPEENVTQNAPGPKSQRAKRKASKPAFQTVEDRLEYERAVEKAQIMSIELAEQPPSKTGTGTDGEPTESEIANEREGRVYLFQFPPDMPDLRRIDEEVTENAESSTSNPATSEPPSTTAANKESNSNEENVIIKSENDDADQKAAILAKEAEDNAPTVSATAQWNLPKLPAGYVGKLRLHKSGRVTIDWAGHAYNVNLGLQASCVQEMVMLNIPTAKTTEPAGAAIPFGQVRGKYVVTPDWDKILPTVRKHQLSKKD